MSSLSAKEDEQLSLAHKKNFTGLPIPAAAAAAVSCNLFVVSDIFRKIIVLTEEMRASLLVFAMIFLGYLMVSRWKFPSLKTLRIKVVSFQQIFLTVLSAVAIFYGVMYHFPLIFFLFSWIYIVIAISLSIVRVIAGKRTKALEDFEPADDEIEFRDRF